MFESDTAGHLHQAHTNPATMHKDAFHASREFIEWLDTIGTSKDIDDKEASDDIVTKLDVSQ